MALNQRHHRIHIYLGEYRMSTTFGMAISKKFTSNEYANIFNTMLPLVEWQEQSIANLISDSSNYDAIHGLDYTFIPDEETRDVIGIHSRWYAAGKVVLDSNRYGGDKKFECNICGQWAIFWNFLS